jgi:hypothetical protein
MASTTSAGDDTESFAHDFQALAPLDSLRRRAANALCQPLVRVLPSEAMQRVERGCGKGVSRVEHEAEGCVHQRSLGRAQEPVPRHRCPDPLLVQSGGDVHGLRVGGHQHRDVSRAHVAQRAGHAIRDARAIRFGQQTLDSRCNAGGGFAFVFGLQAPEPQRWERGEVSGYVPVRRNGNLLP